MTRQRSRPISGNRFGNAKSPSILSSGSLFQALAKRFAAKALDPGTGSLALPLFTDRVGMF